MNIKDNYRSSERFLNGVDVDDDKHDVMIEVKTLLNVLIVRHHRVTASTHNHTMSMLIAQCSVLLMYTDQQDFQA